MSSGRLAAICALVVALVAALVVTGGQAAGHEALPAGGPVIRIVGLGDSVVAGSNCDCQTFVQRYAQIVQARTPVPVRWHNDGAGGLTSGGLLSELASGPVAGDVRMADVVLITIGANDFAPALDAWSHGGCDRSCSTAPAPSMGRNVARIVARVRQLGGARRPLIAVTDYWNVFEDGDVADRDYGPAFAAWSDQVTRTANAAICSAARSGGATCVDLYGPFKAGGEQALTNLLADDGDHPDAAGHQVIAQALAAAVMPAVRRPSRARPGTSRRPAAVPG